MFGCSRPSKATIEALVSATEAATATAATTATTAAVTIPTAIAIAIAIAAAATATATALASLSFVDTDPTTVELRSVQALHGVFGVTVVFEGHETEATGATRVSVEDDLRFGDRTEFLECRRQRLIIRGPGEPTNKQLL
mgnify:CR=1 FL=1